MRVMEKKHEERVTDKTGEKVKGGGVYATSYNSTISLKAAESLVKDETKRKRCEGNPHVQVVCHMMTNELRVSSGPGLLDAGFDSGVGHTVPK